MKTTAFALTSCSLALCAGHASAQGAPQTLALEGDNVSGVGLITSINGIAINDAGDWIVEVDTDLANTDADSALLAPSGLIFQEGQALAAPAGATLDSFDALTLNALGDSAWNFFLDGTSGSSDDSGIYFNSTLVIQEGDISSAAGLSAGTPYIGFFETKFNASGEVLIMSSVDDPAIASSVDRALVLATIDAGGNLLSEVLVAKEGDILPGQTEQLDDLATGPQGFDMNENGDVLFIANLAGSTASDGAVYLNSTLLAQEGSPSPVAGRNWSSLSTSQRVALGGGGDVVFTGQLDGATSDNLLIVRNGAKFRQEGDSILAIGSFAFTSFGSGPVDVDDAGNVLWFGDWDDPDTDVDTGLFLNDTLLVQEGVTSIGGLVVDSLSGVQDGYFLSDDGRWVIFEATLAGGLNGAFLIDLLDCGLATTYCTAKPTSIAGCAPVFTTSGSPSASAGSGFDVQYGPVPGGNVGLQIYTTSGRAAAPASNAFGFLCLDTSALFRLPPAGSGGSTGNCDGVYSVDFNAFFASQTADPSLIAGAQVDLQTWYRDPPNPGTANLSNAIQFVMCP